MSTHEADREKAYAAEKGISGIRVAIVAFNSLVYHFLMAKEGTVEWLAYLTIVGANAYALFVYLGRPYTRFPVMMSSVFTSALDAVFITIWLYATGSFESPFYVLWLVSVTAIAFRYGLRETLMASALYAVSYTLLLLVTDELVPNATDVLVRIVYVFFVGAIGGLIARESAQQTRAKVELQDITRLLRDSEERFRMLSDAAFEGIAVHEHGKILECNKAFARLFGTTPDFVIGKTAFEFIAPESHERIARQLRVQSDLPYQVVGQRADGTTFDVEMVGRDFPYQGRTARVVAVRDITERARAERERREREALQVINERLRELDRMKTQFINNAAHELGTPLTPIKIQTHILSSGNLGPLTERQQKALTILRRNIEHLNVLVRDVLDASRIHAGKLAVNPQQVDLASLAHDAVESFHEAAVEQDVLLELVESEPTPIRADPARITQVLFNLIHNALKFTPAGGRVQVRVRREDDAAVAEVEDNGHGIPPEDIQKLFHPFSQVHDKMERTRSGTGLGLFVSRGIVEEHGGSIACASEGRGLGTRFTFRLPIAQPPSAASGAPANGRSIRIDLAAEEVE